MKQSEVFKSLDGLSDEQVKQMVNWQNEAGLSPLHVAVSASNLGHVQKLVSLGADCSLPDAQGNTALHFAAQGGNLEIVNLLAEVTDDLDLQNNDGETPVILAAHAGHIAAFVSLTSMDKHVVPADTSLLDSNGRNILMHACISGDLDFVRLIVANREGKSQRLSIAKILMNAEDNEGRTALMYAAMESQWALVAVLVSRKANIEFKDHKGRTALHWAAAYGDASTVSALLDCGAKVNDADEKSWTPLMHAVNEDNIEIAQLLIESDANPDHCLGLTRSKALHIMLSDAVRDSLVNRAFYPKSEKPLVLDGRLIVTLNRIDDVYIDPSSVTDGTDDVVVYGVIQWKATGDSDDSETVGITEGVIAERSIVWNETITFYLKEKVVSRDCMLCIDLFATRNHEPISDLFNMEHAAGEDEGDDEDLNAHQAEMDFMHKQIQEYESKELSLGVSQKEAKSALNEFNFSDHKRRWNQLLESRKRLSKFAGINFPIPPVPPGHFPCGSVRISYSRLRELFRKPVGTRPHEPIKFARFPRFADKGQIHFEVDFAHNLVVHREFRGNREPPMSPKESDLPPIVLSEDFFNPPKDKAEAAAKFATRAEKLQIQSRHHYLRWWSTLGQGKSSSNNNEAAGSKSSGKRRFKDEELDLIKTIQIIARSMIDN